MALTGIILAGGQSKRMGQDKGLLDFKGRPMIAHAIEALKSVTDDIMIIANDPAYKDFGLPVYADLFPDTGPLGGICTGLEFSKTERNLVVSCDTPFVNNQLLSHFNEEAGDANLAVCKADRVHPLPGIYTQSIQSVLNAYIANGNLSLMKVLEQIEHVQVTIAEQLPFYHPNLFYNINRPDNLQKAEGIKLPSA